MSIRLRVPGALLFVLALLVLAGVPVARAIGLPSGFHDAVVWDGLTDPTAVRFAPDGRIFVAEKRGVIKVFDSLSDPTPTVLADLSTNVHDFWDRGMLGLAIDPAFPARPYVYVLYTYDFNPATPEIPAPRWGDTCPNPPGPLVDGCVATGRLSRLEVGPNNTIVGPEHVLLENNWCIQYVTHSVGDLHFDAEGALLVSGGEGANLEVDYGQYGGTNGIVPRNPCGDPPGGIGGVMTAPSAQGGALRSQDLQTLAAGDPLTFDGAVLRIDPDTGAAWPDNPRAGGDPQDDRFIAFGLRNPFRFTLRPGTDEVWLGDVGGDQWEEIERIPSVHGPGTPNFGWPCYEGVNRKPEYEERNLTLCQNLYSTPGSVQAPFFAYQHGVTVDPEGDACDTGSSAISGLAFYGSGSYPASYGGALFFADYGRACIYVMHPGANGVPDPAQRSAFAQGVYRAVDLQVGPGGDLFYANISEGAIHRITYTQGGTAPTAVAQAAPTSGPLPLTVQFDGSASSDPDPGAILTYSWDLDGDGAFDDATGVSPQFVYTAPASVVARLRVEDELGLFDTDAIAIDAGNTAPTAAITAPLPNLTWKVGDNIAFTGTGSDPEDGAIPAASFHWEIVLHHCPNGTNQCHEHVIEQVDGVNQGTLTASNHDWSAYLELRLRVTDSHGLSSATVSVTIQPQTVTYSYDSVPSGLSLIVGSFTGTTPFTRPAIVGATISVSAPTPQTASGASWQWLSWSNGGPRVQDLIAGATPVTLTATFTSPKILIVSAHPDDDILVASGVAARAHADGVPVKFVYLTNGDLAGGVAGGTQRQAEAVNSQAILGTAENDLYFFGYPDGALPTLRTSYPAPTDQFTTPFGRSTTYASRGFGGADYHTVRTGSAAPYNASMLRGDLTALIDSYRPTHIVTLSDWDRHADHAATYPFVVEAVTNVHGVDGSYVPSILETILWPDPPNDPQTWPAPLDPTAYLTPVPHLELTDLLWQDRTGFDVPLAMQASDLLTNPKYLAIDAHPSQGGGPAYSRFVHKDEVFWASNPLGPQQPPVVAAGVDQVVGHGGSVQLDGTGSFDPNGGAVMFQWRQVAGTPVTLSDPGSPTPAFTAPLSSQSATLVFELTVADGTFLSLPDAVTVRVQGSTNLAPFSTPTASSEATATTQTAAKAIDGVIAGFPTDFSKEWATNGQGAGAWIELDWTRPYCVDRVVLYDRPNPNDQLVAGTLAFSDASTLPVGPLTNDGSGDTYAFAPKTISQVRLTVTQVSPTTENVGLAEFEVYRCVEADVDGDDWLPSEGDCNNGDPAVHRTPAAVTNVLMSRVLPAGAARLDWTGDVLAGSSTVYEVVGGTLATMRADAGFAHATCLASALPTASFTDATIPTVGGGFYYLVRARNACGAGTHGDSSIVPDPRNALDAASPCP